MQYYEEMMSYQHIMEHQKINFPSRSENLVLVEKLIDKVCEEFHVHEDHYGNILVAVTEAVNNAIYHGNKGNPEKHIKIGFESGDHNIKFLVADEGEGFDMKAYQILQIPCILINLTAEVFF